MTEETRTDKAHAEIQRLAQAAARLLWQSGGDSALVVERLAASDNPVDILIAAYYGLEVVQAAKAS